MAWQALALFLALLPNRWFGQLVARHDAVPTELIGAAVWTTFVTGLFLLASAMVAVVVVEEVAFRGIVLGALLREGGAVPAIALSAAIFSAYHLSVYQLLSTALYGGVLAGLAI